MKLTFRNYINWLYEGVEDKLAAISLKTKIPTEKLQQIFLGDPTPNKMYINWLVKLYINGNVKFPEDAERTQEVLNIFSKVKNNPQFKVQYSNDIGKYKSIQDLWEVIRGFQGINPERKAYSKQLPAGTQEIYNDNIYRIIEIITPEASEILLKNSEWCVKHAATAKEYLKLSRIYLIIKSKYNYSLIAIKRPDYNIYDDDDAINDIIDNNANMYVDRSAESIIFTKDYKDVNDNDPSPEMINELHKILIKSNIIPGNAIYGYPPVFTYSKYFPAALFNYIKDFNENDIIPDIIMTDNYLSPLISDIINNIIPNYGYYIPNDEYYNNGDFLVDKNNMLSSIAGPAIVGKDYINPQYNDYTDISEEDPFVYDDFVIYCINGKIHRNKGPAVKSKNISMWVNKGKIIKIGINNENI